MVARPARRTGQRRWREVDVRGLSFREFLAMSDISADELSLEDWIHSWGDDRV
jgi:hypothetical protein